MQNEPFFEVFVASDDLKDYSLKKLTIEIGLYGNWPRECTYELVQQCPSYYKEYSCEDADNYDIPVISSEDYEKLSKIQHMCQYLSMFGEGRFTNNIIFEDIDPELVNDVPGIDSILCECYIKTKKYLLGYYDPDIEISNGMDNKEFHEILDSAISKKLAESKDHRRTDMPAVIYPDDLDKKSYRKGIVDATAYSVLKVMKNCNFGIKFAFSILEVKEELINDCLKTNFLKPHLKDFYKNGGR